MPSLPAAGRGASQMPISASYSSVTRTLTVLGDALSNSIVVSRNVAGTLFVNGGAVPIAGGPATTVNTDLIEAFGFDLNDVITLDQTNGALPAANLSGGNGSDTLTGGSNADTLNGDVGVDTLFGQGGIDQLFGGTDGDTLTGGDGNDTMNGDAGNDRMIWNPGDDDDVMEGGADSDVAEINGGNGAEQFTIAVNGARVEVRRTDPAPFLVDIGTTETLILNAGGGNDALTATGSLSALILLTIDGGSGDDTILSGNGADVLIGGDGNDFIDGNQGLDIAFLGAGDDVFQWDPGDASDVIEGQSGQDELLFNGSNASESIQVTPNGGRALFLRDVAAITMDLDDVETVTYRALAGADNVVLSDLTGTDVTQLNVNLASSGGIGDGQVDRITVIGTAGAETFGATSVGGAVDVFGLFTAVHITTPEATDILVLAAGSGNDQVNVSGVAVGALSLELQGGLGADTFLGSAGADRILGGDGNDLALMGGGNDEFIWNPGDDNDTLEGQAGVDKMTFNGSAVAESIDISVLSGRTRFFRDVSAVTMDLNDLEQIVFNAGGGVDSVLINDLSGGETNQITLNLASAIGGSVGDAANDVITANGTSGADTVTIAGTGGAYTATGLPYTLAVNQSEAGDTLLVLAGSGADVVSAASLLAGTTSLTLNGGIGSDIVTGSGGADLLLGGTESDTLTGSPGADQMLGEAGNDVMVWNPGDGTDFMEGGDGSDEARVNGGNGAETFTIAANGARVAFNRVDPAPFALDIGTTEELVLFANGGNDTISTTGNLAALISLTIDSGAGDDTILAGNGLDILIAGEGNDFVDGNQANDTALLGAGNDVFQWDPGDGNDTVEGGANSDTLVFNGNAANEIFVVSPNGGRNILTRDIGVVAMDLNDLEQITINAGAGTDNIDVNDVTGSDVTNVTVNLAGAIGGSTGDAQVDTVIAKGTGGANIIDILGSGSSYSVLGLSALLAVNQSEATDQLIIQGLGGNDTISASALPAGVTGLTLDGGTGDDSLSGSASADTLLGGDNNDLVDGNQGSDTAFLGAGNDVFEWDPGDGSDVVNGDGGEDVLLFNGSNASENIDITPNGSRAFFLRDVAAVSMDTDTVETINYNASGGSDNVTIGDMTGTDVTRIAINLAASGGGSDGQPDTITVNAGVLDDNIQIVTTAPGMVTVTGLASVIEIQNFDGTDQLIINAGGGNDVIDASDLDVGIELLVNGGDGNDVVTGGDGTDIFMLGLGHNSIFASPGNDIVSSTGGQLDIFI
jgi:Ca2+-binding RTX toxin-like protein